METIIKQDKLPDLFVNETTVHPDSIRIIYSDRIIFVEKAWIPELIVALNKHI